MSEASYLWTTSSAGDGASTYTRSDLSNAFKVMGAIMDDEGVAMAYLGNLAATTTGVNNCRIANGGALVDGKPYYNSANVDVTIPSASGGGNTRIDRVVLRADWTAQTVRVTRIAGTDAASPTVPAITQNSGVVYDIMLCQCLVNTAGTVTITDERTVARPGVDSIATAAIQALAVTTAKIAANAVTEAKLGLLSVGTPELILNSVDDTIVGNNVPQFYRRQGGSATAWSVEGTTTRTPGATRMQAGSAITDGSGNVTITFPVAFSDKPLVFVSKFGLVEGAAATVISATGFIAHSASGGEIVHWLAIGPE